jgi:hypothetical protein
MASTLEHLEDPVWGDDFTIDGTVLEEDGEPTTVVIYNGSCHISFKRNRSDAVAAFSADSDNNPTYFTWVGTYGYSIDIPSAEVMEHLLPETPYYVRTWLVLPDGSVRSHLRDRVIFRYA